LLGQQELCFLAWAWGLAPVLPATREALGRRIMVQAGPGINARAYPKKLLLELAKAPGKRSSKGGGLYLALGYQVHDVTKNKKTKKKKRILEHIETKKESLLLK
jgi:hypothetical protein